MKSTFLVFLVMACIIAAVMGSPAKDLKDAKKEFAKKKACMQNCDTVTYAPICASKTGANPLSFGNICVMSNYNCEKSETLSKISDGECPNGGAIRLS